MLLQLRVTRWAGRLGTRRVARRGDAADGAAVPRADRERLARGDGRDRARLRRRRDALGTGLGGARHAARAARDARRVPRERWARRPGRAPRSRPRPDSRSASASATGPCGWRRVRLARRGRALRACGGARRPRIIGGREQWVWRSSVAGQGGRSAPAPARARSQHFLRTRTLAAELVRDAAVGPDDLVLDLGAGTGRLTEELARTARRVIAVELDPALARRLAGRWANVEVVEGDAAVATLPREPFRVVANIPFARTNDLLRRLLDDPRTPLVRADLVVERGVAQKRAAVWPSTVLGASWGAWYAFAVTRRLSEASFVPPPTVAAGVLRIERRCDQLVAVGDARAYRASSDPASRAGSRRSSRRGCCGGSPTRSGSPAARRRATSTSTSGRRSSAQSARAGNSDSIAAVTALYRKYRPQDFEEVVGQEPVVRTLTNAIAADQVRQAYLFAGPRGTGKTSMARILAKALNCAQGPTATPDKLCNACVTIANGDVARRDRDGRRLAARDRRHPRDPRARRAPAGRGALQGLHPRRGAPAHGRRLERAAEADRGAAAAPALRLLHDRPLEGARDRPLALPDVRVHAAAAARARPLPAPRRRRRGDRGARRARSRSSRARRAAPSATRSRRSTSSRPRRAARSTSRPCSSSSARSRRRRSSGSATSSSTATRPAA